MGALVVLMNKVGNEQPLQCLGVCGARATARPERGDMGQWCPSDTRVWSWCMTARENPRSAGPCEEEIRGLQLHLIAHTGSGCGSEDGSHSSAQG